MTEVKAADVIAVVDACRCFEWAPYPGGWRGEVEAALIDAVLSIQARYGRPGNGVRGALARYRRHEDRQRLDDLTRLAAWSAKDLQDVLEIAQRTAGVPKAAAIVEAATELVAVGVRHADQVEPDDDVRRADQRRAYTSVSGLGEVTWEYLGMSLGIPGVKADTWIIRFASNAIGRHATRYEARALVIAAAAEFGVEPIRLDYAIWRHMSTAARRRRRPR
ncbi:hypothetical protein [Micromonospora sp. NPDC000729]|uniref:hypothetical protein n=1 Tax=Micromonospora sp. NPDC000729 TaxID=3364220 RepID=UPI0036820C23